MSDFELVRRQIINDEMNAEFAAKGYEPVYTAGPHAKIAIVGQAPGIKAQMSHIPWNDASGRLLRAWMGVTDEQFYDPDVFAIIPMDFYYPGKGVHGDLPPRREFAERWHPQLLKLMPDIRLTLLVGSYAQKYYLGKRGKQNLTMTVWNYEEYLPSYFPLVHPSPLNIGWRARNPWFELDTVVQLRDIVHKIIGD